MLGEEELAVLQAEFVVRIKAKILEYLDHLLAFEERLHAGNVTSRGLDMFQNRFKGRCWSCNRLVPDEALVQREEIRRVENGFGQAPLIWFCIVLDLRRLVAASLLARRNQYLLEGARIGFHALLEVPGP